jgi:hypothetical protein
MNTMKLFRGVAFFISILCTCRLSVSAQQIDSMMDVYRDYFPQEKVHVHFDKSYYNPGETIWFKAYLMSGTTLSGISKNFYAELVNEKGMVVQKIAAPVISASAAASFQVPSDYAGQVLHFRGYTTWMLNFDTTFIFQKQLPVLGNNVKTVQPTSNSTSLQFFPEGGDLVNDVESVLAFKANDRYGLPVKVTGFIRSAAGKKIIDFASQHDGMGIVRFTPLKGETYTAVWKDSTQKEMTAALPAHKTSGVVLSTRQSSNAVVFTVRRTADVPDDLKQLNVIAHMNQQTLYKAKVNMSAKTEVSASIPVADLPAGIVQVTVFNSKWQPVAERILFVNNNNYIFDAYFRTLSKNVTRRGKNVIEIEVPDTLLSNLSIAITDAPSTVSSPNEDNIYSRLLVTGDVKGYVHNPGYYFSSFADSVSRHLDLVMLTHGWRRFKWEDVAQRKIPQIKYAPENYLSLKGSVIGIDPAKLGNGAELNLFLELKDSSRQFFSAPLKAGKFELSNMLFYDTAKIYYQLNNKKLSAADLVLKVENGLWKGYNTVQVPEFSLAAIRPPDAILNKNKDIYNKTVTVEGERRLKAKTLQEVIVRGQKRTNVEKMDEKYAGGLFRGGDGMSFDLTTDLAAQGAISIFHYLQGRVAGLMITMGPGGPTLSWRGGSPELFLNEMRTDPQGLSSIPVSDIAYVKVLRPPFMGATGGGANGAIAVYTRKGDERQVDNFKGLNRITVPGYSPAKEFYSPDYSVADPMHELDDLRTTIYWAPFIFLDKEKKKVSITFYNNDISKELKVVIEGVNEIGQLTRVEEMIR